MINQLKIGQLVLLAGDYRSRYAFKAPTPIDNNEPEFIIEHYFLAKVTRIFGSDEIIVKLLDREDIDLWSITASNVRKILRLDIPPKCYKCQGFCLQSCHKHHGNS